MELESEDSSEDSNTPYPSTFKNAFWKDLEAGRINVFDNDMYSKVKGRAAKPTDSKELGNSVSSCESEKSAYKKRHSSDPEKPSKKASCKKTTKSKSTVKIKDKFSEGHSNSSSVKASARRIDFKCVITSESESDSDILDRRKSYPLSVNIDSEKDKDVESLTDRMDQNPLLKTPERDSEITSESLSGNSAQTINYSLIDSDGDKVGDTVLRTPEVTKCTLDSLSSSSARTINYSFLQNSENEESLSVAGEKDENCEVSSLMFPISSAS